MWISQVGLGVLIHTFKKAIIHRKKLDCFTLLEKDLFFFFKKDAFYDIVQTSYICLFLPFYNDQFLYFMFILHVHTSHFYLLLKHHLTWYIFCNKNINFSVVVFVCCITSCSEICLSQDGVFQRSMGCNKKIFLVTNHGGDLW